MYASAALSTCPTICFPTSTSPLPRSVFLVLSCKYVHQYHFSRFHIYICVCVCVNIYLFFSFWLTSLCMTYSRFIHITTNDQFQITANLNWQDKKVSSFPFLVCYIFSSILGVLLLSETQRKRVSGAEERQAREKRRNRLISQKKTLLFTDQAPQRTISLGIYKR